MSELTKKKLFHLWFLCSFAYFVIILFYFCFGWQLFVANQDKPADVVNILIANKSKLLRLFSAFKVDGGG